MANQTGIEIHIKAWLPTGKGLDEQFTALSLVKAAHESGDYAPLLAAASIEAVKTESKTRRMEAAAEPAKEPTAWQAATEEPEPAPTGETARVPISADKAVDLITSGRGDEVFLSIPTTEPAPESNVGDAPVDQPSLVPDDDALPNPIRKGRKAA